MIKLFNQSIGRLRLTKTKSVIHASLIVGTLVALLLSPGKALGQAAVPSNPFVLLLKGIFEPVVHGPDLGLSQVDLNDATYLKVSIYGVSGIPGTKKDKTVGTLYGSMADGLFAYHLPGGSFSAKILSFDTCLFYISDGADA